MTVTSLHPAYIAEDLARSGLETQDVRARVAGPNEKQATNTPIGVDAYVLPYFDMYGRPLPFYRTKLINNPDPKVKYKQVATSSNHVYFPPGFAALLRNARYIILTEGEKKAAAAVKHGFCCAAFGGVDSWRNRTVVLHKDSQVGTSKSGQVVAKIPAGSEISEKVDTLALGLTELIDYAKKRNIPIFICYDSDLEVKGFVRFEVQRAAATLGYELRHRGILFANIRQLILKPENSGLGGKLGLDDFLLHDDLGPEAFEQLIHDTLAKRTAFPRHPNPREYVNRKLQKAIIPRSEIQSLAMAVICELDSKGIRLHCPNDGNMYYFDEETHKLTTVRFSNQMDFSSTQFGIKMYNDYGVTSADWRLITVLHAQFCGEQPIQEVKPEKVLAIRGNKLYYQLSDGLMVRVDPQNITVLSNGSDDVLFEGDLVKTIPHLQLMDAVKHYAAMEQLPNLWYPVLQEARIKESVNDYMRKLLSLLYSISPWMYRWRGTQLPIEQMIGEAGSGKSTLYELRQMVITGITSLKNAPREIRDWTASVAATGAIHVTDNVHMGNQGLKQQLSDELCRVITETDPHIEARKLYTDNELIRVPVKTVFAVTAIKQPFTNTDIIQRSIITELDKGLDEVEYSADWKDTQLQRYGGRIQWVGHQLVFIQRLFQMIEKDWQQGYKAKYRLINVEQLLHMAAKIYGWDSGWIPSFLETSRDERTARSDAALEGLIIWADAIRRQGGKKVQQSMFTTRDMVQFFESEDEFAKNIILTSGRMLGHYLEDKKNTISTIAGIVPLGRKVNNYNAYKVVPVTEN